MAEDLAQPAAGSVRRRALAIGLAFFREYVDKRFTTPEEIRQQLRLPYLGLVPRVKHGTSEVPLINNGVPAGFAEAFRAVRTNVLFATGTTRARCS